MMIAILLATAQLAAVADTPPPLAEWNALAPLPWKTAPVLGAEIAAFVASEVQAGRCAPAQSRMVAVAVAARITDTGLVKAAVPESIGCPTVEQYAAGLVASFARNNLRPTPTGWYRVTVGFTLPG